jgi:hypothetical protein
MSFKRVPSIDLIGRRWRRRVLSRIAVQQLQVFCAGLLPDQILLESGHQLPLCTVEAGSVV